MKYYIAAKNKLNIIKERSKMIELEQKQVNEEITELEKTIKIIEQNLKELQDPEYKIFYQMVINGLKPTEAVRRVSFEVGKEESTLWKNYYPKVKKILSEISYIEF